MITQAATEAEALAFFLRAELDSPTEADRLKATLASLSIAPEMLLHPDTSIEADNARRRSVFEAYRGSEPLFDELSFGEISWHWADLSEKDLRERTLTCRYHFEPTYGTRNLAGIAAIIDQQVPAVRNAVVDRLRNGEVLDPPILLAEPNLERLVVLEGHNRLISYIREPDAVRFPIRALIGVSSRISQWREW